MIINKQIFVTLFVLFVTIVYFSYSNLDFVVQNTFFDFKTHSWMLNSYIQPYRFIFYDGIKKLLILLAFSFLLVLIFFRKKKLIQEYKRGMIIVILSALLVPLVVSSLKKYTNMPCPKSIVKYGGIYPHTKVWEHYPKTFVAPQREKCWPAGHASGGFALLSLFFLFKTRKNRWISLGVALLVGWSMGLYKMIIGDHFLSHTVITMIMAWLIILIVVKALDFKKNI